MVSSTTVTWAYARLAHSNPTNSVPLAAGVTTAWAISLMRMSTIAVVLSPGLARPLLSILALPILILIRVTLLIYSRSKAVVEASPLALSDPFELTEVLKFGALLAGVTLIAKLAGSGTSQIGLLPLAAVSGLVDVDPITLSVSRVAGQTVTYPYASAVIVVAGGANLLCKTVLAATLGPRSFALLLISLSIVAAACAVLVFAFLHSRSVGETFTLG
jgi:uncharacterized membrane protein (DUF4010 family)